MYHRKLYDKLLLSVTHPVREHNIKARYQSQARSNYFHTAYLHRVFFHFGTGGGGDQGDGQTCTKSHVDEQRCAFLDVDPDIIITNVQYYCSMHKHHRRKGELLEKICVKFCLQWGRIMVLIAMKSINLSLDSQDGVASFSQRALYGYCIFPTRLIPALWGGGGGGVRSRKGI